MTQRKYRAPALERGLKIIELLATESHPLGMGSIAGKLGYSRSEIFRMLVVLQEHNYIERLDNTDLFVITDKILSISMQIHPTSTLLEIAIPQMRTLANTIRQSCHLAVLNNTKFVVIARAESPAAIGFSVRAGHNAHAHLSGSGMLLLALSERNRAKHLIDKIANECDESGDVFHKKQVLEDLNTIAKNGYAICSSHFHDTITDIAVPITKGKSNAIMATLCVPFLHNHNFRISQEQVLEKAQQVAETISQDIQNLPLP